MKRLLYANGDSFTFGMEIIKDYDHSETNKDFAYPATLAQLLDIETCVNAAYVGAGNEFIFRQTMFDLLDLEQEGYSPDDVFVVVGWSCVDRTEVSANKVLTGLLESGRLDPELEIDHPAPELMDYGTLFINPGYKQKITLNDGSKFNIAKEILPPCVRYFWDFPSSFRRSLSYICALEHFLRSKGYKFLFLNGIYNLSDFDVEWKPSPIKLDSLEFFEFETFGIWNYANRKYPEHMRAQHHVDKFIHDLVAEMLAKYIKEQKLL